MKVYKNAARSFSLIATIITLTSFSSCGKLDHAFVPTELAQNTATDPTDQQVPNDNNPAPTNPAAPTPTMGVMPSPTPGPGDQPPVFDPTPSPKPPVVTPTPMPSSSPEPTSPPRPTNTPAPTNPPNSDPTPTPTPDPQDPEENPDPDGNCQHGKIAICHVPPGNPANKHTICVSRQGACHGHGVCDPFEVGGHGGDTWGACTLEQSE